MLHQSMIESGVTDIINKLKAQLALAKEEGAQSIFDTSPFFFQWGDDDEEKREVSYGLLKGDLISLLSQKAKGGQKSMRLEIQETAMFDLAHLMDKAGLSGHPVPLYVAWEFDFEKRCVHYIERVYYQAH
jgi:hypothetical protein